MIERLNGYHFPATQQSTFNDEELTALQLAARTANKQNEVIDKVNDMDADLTAGLGTLATIPAQVSQATENAIDELITSGELGTIVTTALEQVATEIVEDVTANTAAIAENTTDITENANNLTAHAASLTAHMEGVNVIKYVSTTGNDSNDGSAANPYRTMAHAIAVLHKFLNGYETKIRVFAGDYSAEGAIAVDNFAGGQLTIVGWTGEAEVSAISDSYIFSKFNFHNLKYVNVVGLKFNHAVADDYGAFVEGCGYFHAQYCKDNGNAAANSMFGITRGTNFLVENCYGANKVTVISANHGSKGVSKDWDANSTNNTQCLWAHGGGEITQIGTQPQGTYLLVRDNGGYHVAENGKIIAAGDYHFLKSDNSNPTANTITITIDMPYAPTEIDFYTIIDGAKMHCFGKWSAHSQYCMSFRYAQNCALNSGNVIELDNGAGQYSFYSVSSVSKTAIVLTRNTGYTAIPSVTLKILASCR